MKPSPEPDGTISQFEKLLADLARSGIDCAVVGGLAVILNGYPRLTQVRPDELGLTVDADIIVHTGMREICAREAKKS